MYLSAPISTRNQFGQLLNHLGLTNLAVEVGTHQGEFAGIFLSSWEGKSLWCIDPWGIPVGYEPQMNRLKGKPVTAGDRENDMEMARKVYHKYPGRMTLMRNTSNKAVDEFGNREVDFVYVDGDHRRDQVYLDLFSWWPKVRPGGILAGHDWLCPGEYNGGWGREIQPVVRQFEDTYNLDCYLVVEENGLPWSFYFIKPRE